MSSISFNDKSMFMIFQSIGEGACGPRLIDKGAAGAFNQSLTKARQLCARDGENVQCRDLLISVTYVSAQ